METIINSLIPSFSALIGAIIGSAMSSWIEIYKKEYEIKQERKKVYSEYINAMQKLMNENSDENFVEFQKAINILLLYASSKVVDEVNTYYVNMISQEKNGFLNAKQHAKHQNKIINLMRRDLDKNAEEVANIKLVAFNPPKVN